MPDFDPNTILVAPVDDIIQQLARSVASAQLALDRATLAAQKALLQPEYDELRALGYQPSWYVIPEATFEVKLAFYIEDKTVKLKDEGKGSIYGSTLNATYQNTQSFQAEGASTLRVRIVPIPPSQVIAPSTGD
jgi:hypothetical protein